MAVILITGAGSGIGLALSTLYAAEGHRVYAACRSLENYPSALDHRHIHPFKMDVTRSDDIEAAFHIMPDLFGFPDILINNAGINLPGIIEESIIEESDDAIWQKIFAVNFWAPLHLAQKILPPMRQAGRGVIVMMSSLSAEAALPGDGPYAASKAAVTRAAEALSHEVADFGIKVIILQPGAVRSNLNQTLPLPKRPLLAYNPLRSHLQKRGCSKNSGMDTEDIALEIRALIDDPDCPLICPVGEQAKDIIQKLKIATPTERNHLIRTAAGL